MAQGKKISELNEVSSVTDNDEFLFVDKEGSGANSGVGGKTAKIKFSDLKSAIGAGTTGAKGASGDKGMKGEPGPRGLDGEGTQYWTQSPTDGSNIYYDQGLVGIGTDSPTHHLHLSGDAQVKLKLESTGGNTEVQFTRPNVDDATAQSNWMIGQSATNSFFVTKHGAGSGYQLELTKNSHKIKSDNGGLYLTKEGTPGNSTIDLVNDNLLDYTEQGGNSAIPAAASMKVQNADGFAQFGVSTSNGHIINTTNNEEPAGPYQKGEFGFKIRSQHNDGTQAPVLIGNGGRWNTRISDSSIIIRNNQDEYNSLGAAGVHVRGGSHTNVDSTNQNWAAVFELASADYEITGDFRNRTIMSRAYNHNNPLLQDAFFITHEVKGVHKSRMIINRDGNIHLDNSMKLGIGKEPSTSLDINGNMAINLGINLRRQESELNGGTPKTQGFIRAKHIQEGVQPNSNLDPIVPDPDNFRTDMPSGLEIGPFLHIGYTGETAHSNTMKELTGKFAALANSNKITGTDTKFLSELGEKHMLKFGSAVHMVASVESDTELTLTDNWDWWKTPSTYTYADISDQTAYALAERAGLRVSPQIGSASAICFSDNNNTNAMTYLVSGTTSSGWLTKDYKTAISVRQSNGDVCVGKRLPDCKLHVWSDDEPGKAQVKISAHQGANPTDDGSAKPAEIVIENEKAMIMVGVKESKGHIINFPTNGLATCIRSEYLTDTPDPRSGTIPAGSFAPISFGHGGGQKFQMQEHAFFIGERPVTRFNPSGHFFLANHPWAEYTTYEREYPNKFYYSPEHRGMLCKGITGVIVRCYTPIDPTCSYRITVRAKQISNSTLPGENVFYAGVQSYDHTYNVLATDTANSYNYGLANNSPDLKNNVGVSQTFTANFHGYNPPASEGTGVGNKFDPEANFFNVAMLVNYNSNGGDFPSDGVTVIEMVEVKKLDT